MTDNQSDIDGFDPLTIDVDDPETKQMLDEQNRRIVLNILKSYTGYYDLFSELIQNALDAVEAKSKVADPAYKPTIWIEIDIPGSRVRVTDNGIGMTARQLKYFVKPNVSFKKPREFRGQKGVGATFLAYGFSLIRINTRQEGSALAVHMRQGRQWAQDQNDSVPRPKLSLDTFEAPELGAKADGTSVEIVVGGIAGERPKRMDWIGARTALQWIDVLRIKTPLGGVYLKTSKFSPTVHVSVKDSGGAVTTETVQKPEYFYPHETPNKKVATVKDLEAALSAIPGSPEDKSSRLDSSFKRLDCLWEIYDTSELVSKEGPFGKTIDDEQRALIEKHQVVVYAAFLASAKMWGELNEDIFGLTKGVRIIRGGLQMASDYMVQGDSSIIPLTSTIGYQANTHVIVHFTDGSPDMGRKTFQPELEDLAKRLSVSCVNIFKRYLQNLKPDTGAVAVVPDKELHEWRKKQEAHQDRLPLSFKAAIGNLSLVSEPQQEQDVIALFHELVGLDVIRGLKFMATSQSDRYDSLYLIDYEDDQRFIYNKASNPLAVGFGVTLPYSSEPRVLEYKYDLDALVRDFSSEVKFAKHVNFVVCWKAEKQYKERYFLNSLLVGDEASSRFTFGATHQAFPAGGGSQPDFEVCILQDLLGYLIDPVSEEARQKLLYND